jgi:phosphoserine aminotransferase
MPTREEIAYFGAGPAPLPTPVLEAGAASFLNHENSGLGLAEISHRSSTANGILADAKESLAKVMDIPTDEYEILFCHGGGTGGFASVVHNLVPVWVENRRKKAVAELGEGKEAEVVEKVKQDIKDHLKIDYLVTGSWSLKASQEAANLLEPLGPGHVNVAVDSRKANNGKFGKIPDEGTWTLSGTEEHNDMPGAAFVYYCDNETVDGVEFPNFPERLARDGRIPVADMSSNFLSRAVDVRKYGVIFVSSVNEAASRYLADIVRRVVPKRTLVSQI